MYKNEETFDFYDIHDGIVFFSCREEKSDPGYLAGIAAKGYYDLLLEGKYKEFVDGYNQPYRLPNGYQDQLLMNAKMFVEQQQDEHKGMVKVNVLNAKADTAHHVADVFCKWCMVTVLKNRLWYLW